MMCDILKIWEGLMDISDKIIKLRKKNTMSREALASRMGVDRSVVERWEKGLLVPDKIQIRKLGQIFEVEPSYLANNRADDDRTLIKGLIIYLDHITKGHKRAVVLTAVVSLVVAFLFLLLAIRLQSTSCSVISVITVLVSCISFIFYGRNKKR